MLILNHALRASIEEWKRNTKLAKLGRVISAHQLQNIGQVKMPVSEVLGPVVYTGRLNDRDVLISLFSTEEQLQKQATIMNNLSGVRNPHVVDFFGCCCVGGQLG